MPCYCPNCTDNPSETYTEKYKLQCIERHRTAKRICEIVNKSERVKEIESYGKRHGPVGLEKLKMEIKRQWEISKKNHEA
ncbi:hypothetical protein C8R28_100885 [Nitrosomonas ureae]|uniref:Uncharacterized protein n=1 Tax=Nitrosomonas ureae TaxID=44577 RepID=A0A2T5ISR9_9PROT|nr:hypothetical protein C8R28_100885 [Nitrosomonas ureae]